MKPKTKTQVKAIQTALNKKGAKLVVDGVQGKLTNAAIAKYGGGGSTTSNKNLITNKNNESTRYNQYSQSKPVGSYISAAKPKSRFGKILNTVTNKIKETVNGKNLSANSGYATNKFTYNDGLMQDNPINETANFSGIKTLYKETIPDLIYKATNKPGKVVVNNKKEKEVYSEPQVFNSQNIPLLEVGKPLPGGDTSNEIVDNNIDTNTNKAGSKEIVTKTYTNPQTGDTTTQTMEMAGTNPIIPVNYTGMNGANNAIMGINTDLKALQGQGNVWESDNGKSLINNRITSWTDDIAKNFKTVADFENSYNSNPNFAANVNGLASIGLTPETIKAKIEAKTTTAINGILPPQTTSEYLDSMVDNLADIPKINTGDKTIDANLREQALLERGYTKEYIDMLKGDHNTVGLLEKDKIEADQAIENLNEKIVNKEESIRDKADYLIDKAKYEFDKADAELEINRLNAKNYAVGFLAQIGALSTASAAMDGILNLDLKYQAQRQDLRNNYQMGIREIKMNMNDQINTLEENRDDNILKINSDLSKSEREITLEIMKLTYQTNKSMLEIKTKADEKLQDKKDKAEAKAISYSSQYNDSLWKLISPDYNIPMDVAKTMINYKGDPIPTQENVDKMAKYSTKKLSETEPKFTGETLKINEKVIKEFENKGGNDTQLIKVQNLLNEGWSLQQIAKNTGMPTDLYNYLKSKLTTTE
jgi:hypothetical protein